MDITEAKLAFDLGTKFYSAGKLEESLPYYYKALQLFKKGNYSQNEADVLLEIGDIYIEMGKLSKAQKNYEKSLDLYNQIKDYIGAGYSLVGLGIVSERYNKHEEAREYYQKAMKKFQKANDYKRAGIISNLIANTYEMQEALEDALIDYKISLELFKKVKDRTRERKINIAINKLESRRSKIRVTKTKIAFLAAYLIFICTAEVITTYYSLELGLSLHVAILFILLIHSSLEESYNFSNLLMSMMAIPMIRIISLSLPIMQIDPLYRFFIIAIPLFAASFMIIRIQKLNRVNLGLTLGNIPIQLTIALSGLFLGFIEYLILKPAPLIPHFNFIAVLSAGFIILISTGLAEELLFRGIIQKNIENVYGNIFGLLYASLLFTSLHIGWNSAFDWAFVFMVALFYGYVFQKTRSLFGITLSHGISNSMLFLVMPFIAPKIIHFLL
ncbi:tetratricopeptide repeat protein [Methanobacterium oryzae]|uniref:tetratricopeptide repeat protein n=1 Tax=Methanobacterium oryzae TaxID=69540 RepID=UPI003D1AA8E8